MIYKVCVSLSFTLSLSLWWGIHVQSAPCTGAGYDDNYPRRSLLCKARSNWLLEKKQIQPGRFAWQVFYWCIISYESWGTTSSNTQLTLNHIPQPRYIKLSQVVGKLHAGQAMLLRRWINVIDVDSTSQQRRIPRGGRCLNLMTVTGVHWESQFMQPYVYHLSSESCHHDCVPAQSDRQIVSIELNPCYVIALHKWDQKKLLQRDKAGNACLHCMNVSLP